MAHLSTSLLALGGLLVLAGAARGQAISFAPVVTYATGGNSLPRALAVGDVNGDGKTDVLTANTETGMVGVLLGNGNGTFQAATTYLCGANSGPFGIAVADINGDGKQDVLTANASSSTVGVLLGNGNGTFQPAVTYLAATTGVTNHPGNITVADVNLDNKLDVIIANYDNRFGSLGVLLGNGNGTLQPMTTYGIGLGPRTIAVADVNLDGKPDLLTANPSSNSSSSAVSVLLNNGSGNFVFTGYPSGVYCYGIAAADVNSDGKPDLLTANTTSQNVGVLLNAGNGTFQAATLYPASAASSIAVADVDGDNKLDLLVNGAGVVGVLPGNGNGTFRPIVSFPSTASSVALVTADVNGDNRPDLLTVNYSSSTISVLLNTTPLPTRTTLPGATATLAPNPAGAATRLGLTGLPASAATVQATVLDATGREVLRKQVPTRQGAAQADLPTAGLAPGLYVVQLAATDDQGSVVGALPAQRLSVE